MAPVPLPSLGDSSLLSTPQAAILHIKSILQHTTTTAISKRQSAPNIIPTTYSNLNTGPAAGTVVGIVLGSVAGFLLILWLLYTLFGGGPIFVSSVSDTASSIVVRERRKHSSSGARSRRHSETVEVRRAPPVVERIVVEERRREREVRSESSGGEDEVVVIEEHSPPRRSKSKRESGYRTVDPMAYGGGDRPMRDVDRKSSRRSRG